MSDNIQILNKNELDKILSESEDDNKKLDSIIKFCRDNYNITHDICEEYADAGLIICDRLKLSSQKNILNTYNAFFLWHKNEPQKALSLIHSFSDQLLECKSYLEYSLGVIICSLIEWSRGNVELAFNSINLAFDSLVNKKNTKFAIVRLHWTLGVIYFDLDEIEDSFYHYQFCKDSLSNETDYSMVAYINVGLALVLKKRNELKKATDLFEETLEYSTKHNIWMVEARAWHELGLLEMINKNYLRAIELIVNSVKIRYKNNAVPALVSSMISLAEIDIALNKFQDAFEKLSEALIICKEKKLKPKMSTVFLLLSELKEKQNFYKESLLYLKKHYSLEKELINLLKNNKNKYLQLNYKAEKALRESESQKMINNKLVEANELIVRQKNSLVARNQEKEILLKEIHHRVKNNLQIITSLLSLQSQTIEEKKIKELFNNSQDRINSMALIHEMLYQTNNLSKINFHDYIVQLINSLVSSYKGMNHNIEVKLDIPEIYLNVDTAIPLGLLINEILTNSLKYAFPDENKGLLYLQIFICENNRYILKIGDDGPGYSDPQNLFQLKSLGLKLIHKLIKQIEGEIKRDKSQKGANYIINFRQIT